MFQILLVLVGGVTEIVGTYEAKLVAVGFAAGYSKALQCKTILLAPNGGKSEYVNGECVKWGAL